MAAQPTMGKENVAAATKQEPPALAALDLTGAVPPPPPMAPPAATPSKPPAPLLTPRSAPPPPPPPAPIACPRIEAKDFETLAAALEAAHAKPGRVDVVVAEGTTLAGTIKVPAGVRLVGSAGTRPVITNTLTLNGDGAGVMNCDLREGVEVQMGTKDTEVRGCLITNPCDAGILSRGAALTISDCELYECEDAVRHTYGDRLTLVRCQIRNIDGDGICSIPKISLLEDVTFENIGRHEVMCKAGVLRKVTSPIVEPPPPPPVPVSQLPYGPAG